MKYRFAITCYPIGHGLHEVCFYNEEEKADYIHIFDGGFIYELIGSSHGAEEDYKLLAQLCMRIGTRVERTAAND